MKKNNEEEFSILEENSNVKQKLDWIHLNDLESLISQMNTGKKLRCIVYDTETTGINFKKDHILELAAVELINFGLTGRTFHIYIKPRVFVPKNVQELNHIKYNDFQKYWEYYYQDTKTQLENFLEFIGNDSYLVCHNATFDYHFLNSELRYWGLPELPNERFRCTLRMVKKIFKSEGIDTPNFKLFTCCEYFKILVNENEGSYHNGLFDTIMTSKLLIHLYKTIANTKDNENVQNNNYKYSNNNKYKNNNKYSYYNKNSPKPRYNKFDPDNINVRKEKYNNDKKPYKIEDKPKDNNINNNNINNNNMDNNVNIENKEEKDNKNANNNEISEGKLNGVELNLLIKKMNEMIINEESKINKDK